jgi:branched-chain amino acid transport system substrate-binding protein
MAAKMAAELSASGVKAIIGPITSSMVIAALPVVEKDKVVMVTPTATSMQLVGRDDHLFRINAATRDYARAYADFHYRVTGLRHIAIAMDVRNRAFTQSWLDEFRPAYTARGGRISTVVTFESADNVSFSDVTDDLLKSRPDGLLFIAGTVDVVRLAQQARRRSPQLPLVAVEWAASEKLHELGGAEVEGLHVVESYDRSDRSARYSAFVDAYRKRFQLDPGYTSVNAYDAATVIIDALDRKRPDQGLKEALLATGPFDGLQQAIVFDRYGDTTRKGFFMTMREGRLEPAR